MAGGSKVNGTLVEVEQNLKDEEQRLLQMKELILKEMKVLKAEEVTIQRLIKAHTRPLTEVSSDSPVSSDKPDVEEMEQSTDDTSMSLPEINLNIRDSKKRNTNSDSEEEIDTDDEMEPEDYCRKK